MTHQKETIQRDNRHFEHYPTKDKKKFEIDVDIDLPDEIILKLALMAHERDITLNEVCIDILREYIKKRKCRHDALDSGNRCEDCGDPVKVI